MLLPSIGSFKKSPIFFCPHLPAFSSCSWLQGTGSSKVDWYILPILTSGSFLYLPSSLPTALTLSCQIPSNSSVRAVRILLSLLQSHFNELWLIFFIITLTAQHFDPFVHYHINYFISINLIIIRNLQILI